MEEGNKTVAPADGSPAPSPALDPAVLTPTGHASFDSSRRDLLSKWLSEEVKSGEASDADVADPEAQAESDAESPTPEPEALDTDSDEVVDETDAPIQEEAADDSETEIEPATPKPYSAKAGEEDFTPPEDLKFTYKADGAERTRTLDEVIKYAQLGENFDRRSRELATTQRAHEEQYRQLVGNLQQQFTAAQGEMHELLRRIAEDEDFREEYLEEYERLRENPEEIELRRKALRADELERALNSESAQKQQAYVRQVQETVNTIIDEQLSDYEPELRESLAARVRERFMADLQKQGRDVLREQYLVDLIRQERGVIDLAVERARRDAQRDLEPVVKKARAEAAVETRNKITDQALQRDKTSKVTPKPTAVPSPDRRPKPPRSMGEASQALKNWAES